MMQTISLLAMLALTLPAARAQNQPSNCGELDRQVEAQDLECLVRELVSVSFPELKEALADGRILIQKFNSEESFLRTTVVSGIVRASVNRQYAIEVNPSMYRTFLPVLPRPSLRATRAALAHELVHLVEFESSGMLGMIKEVKGQRNGAPSTERKADLRVMELGYAEGLLEFRQWHFSRLNPAQVADIQPSYYTPEEIQAWIEAHDLARPIH